MAMPAPEAARNETATVSPLVANRDVADLLDRIARLLAIQGENPFRVRAYQEAAAHIRGMNVSIVGLWRAGRLTTIPGVGPSIAAKVADFLQTGRSPYLEELQKTVPSGVEQLLNIPGVGPKRARTIAERLNVRTPEGLADAGRAHRLRGIPGFGPRLEERLVLEAQRWAQREHRLLLGVAWPAAEQIVTQLRHDPTIEQVAVAGSLRRMRETIGDIDLLAASRQPAAATAAFTRLPLVREVLATGPTKATILVDAGLQVDLRVVEPASWGAALQHFTGSKLHNIALRDRAIGLGLRLNEYGIFEERSGRRIGGEEEIDVYRALGLSWIPPELREDRGEIQAAAVNRLPTLIEIGDLRGDLHCHTNWSDGTASVAEMSEAARAVGLDYLAITDHSPSLTIARGLTPQRLRLQRREIDEVNHRMAPFRVLQGAEVDILPNGSLDLPAPALAELDYVSISVHSAFSMGREEMTKRIIRGIGHPGVASLNHPTGRLIEKRPGYAVDLEAVLRAAAAAGVAVEIDGEMHRLDLDDVWSRRAKDLGCSLVVDSDAHSPRDFQNLTYGVAVARRGWLGSANVLNTLPLNELEAWLVDKKRRVA